jgi:hypothetical protein
MYIEYGFLYLTRPELTVQYATNQYLPSTIVKNAIMDAAKDAGNNLSNVICSIKANLKGIGTKQDKHCFISFAF